MVTEDRGGDGQAAQEQSASGQIEAHAATINHGYASQDAVFEVLRREPGRSRKRPVSVIGSR
jgi:hypothetical protein